MRHAILAVALAFSCSHSKDSDDKEPGSQPVKPSDPAGPGVPPGGIVEQQQYMVFHNLKRCWHRVADVKWSPKLADGAKAHAAKCTLAKDPVISGKIGENIAFGKGLGQIKAQDNWYMEFIFFPYGQKDGSDKTDHFSQIVWRETAEIGCASAKCGDQNYYVCRYSPVGNVKGKYDNNVYSIDPNFMKCTGMPRGQ